MATATSINSKVQIYSKIILSIVLLFFFSSCGIFYPYTWIEETTSPRCGEYWSSRLTYPSSSLQMEIVKDNYVTRVYLNLLICPVEPDDPESQMISFTYYVGSAKYTGTAYVLKGGQRLLLDDQASNKLISFFGNNKEIRVVLGMYDEAIPTE